MDSARFFNITRQAALAGQARMATSFLDRSRGLLFARPIVSGEGLFLMPCNSIHMFGMTYAIDAIFLDDAYKVVALVENIKPMHISMIYFKATSCLELPVGTIINTKTAVGDQVEIAPL